MNRMPTHHQRIQQNAIRRHRMNRANILLPFFENILDVFLYGHFQNTRLLGHFVIKRYLFPAPDNFRTSQLRLCAKCWCQARM
ncbi:hypothetical protein CGZ88_0740 [Bifidobacterium anseris]|uniref:Uncharacterized protein n=1 Tax=Bifidobacterium anseris TaxID=2020963 RepID=A0A2N5J300_9BIFI|nr:hypothetical protein CGZ88_0740 [Bifidobacterium anseris]